MDWIMRCLRKYATFGGRARRVEYWMFVLFTVVVQLVASIVDIVLGTTWAGGELGLLQTAAVLGLLLPTFAVSARRLHDTNRSAWWLLAGLVPVVGTILLLVFFCLRGTPGPNRFGDDPLAIDPGGNRPAAIAARERA